MTPDGTSTRGSGLPSSATPQFWDELERERRELPDAWIATVAPSHRAHARRAYRLHPPSSAALAQIADLLASAAPATKPAGWLTGNGEYAGVVSRHPVVPGCYIVASHGVIAVGSEHELRVDHETGPFFVDRACATERLLVGLIAECTGQRERLKEIGAVPVS